MRLNLTNLMLNLWREIKERDLIGIISNKRVLDLDQTNNLIVKELSIEEAIEFIMIESNIIKIIITTSERYTKVIGVIGKIMFNHQSKGYNIINILKKHKEVNIDLRDIFKMNNDYKKDEYFYIIFWIFLKTSF